MPVRSRKWPFTAAAIEHFPHEWRGVYVLRYGESVLYIGSARDGGRSMKALRLGTAPEAEAAPARAYRAASRVSEV